MNICHITHTLQLNFYFTEYICYDDGCHLRKFARHTSRKDETITAQKLASIEIVVDKMHMAGHTDQWCLTNCDPHLFSDFNNVSRLHLKVSLNFCTSTVCNFPSNQG